MKRIIRLTESDLARIVKRVIKEEQESTETIPGCTDTKSAKGQNLGCITNRKPYYDMMKAGKSPKVLLTYKLDGPWFDAHTYNNLFDNATYGAGYKDEELASMLWDVRSGRYGVMPGSNASYALAPSERQKSEDFDTDKYGINKFLESIFK